MKKFLSILLSVIMACGTLPLSVIDSFAAADITEDLIFSALTDQQFKTLKNGGKISASYKSQIPKEVSSSKLKNLPKSFSLANYNLDTPVGDQGDLSTCWAFAALTSSENFFAGKDSFYNFSERHLSWFSYSSEDQQDAFRYVFDDVNPYLVGGFDFTATNTLANWWGPVNEEDYEYSDEPIDESERTKSVAHLQNVIFFPEYETLDDTSEETARNYLVSQVKEEMYKTRQGVDISYCASYERRNYNPETHAWYNPEEKVPTTQLQLSVGMITSQKKIFITPIQ